MLLTASDVSRRAAGRITPHSIRHAADRGELPCVRTAGGVRLFDENAVTAWLTSRGLLIEMVTR